MTKYSANKFWAKSAATIGVFAFVFAMIPSLAGAYYDYGSRYVPLPFSNSYNYPTYTPQPVPVYYPTYYPTPVYYPTYPAITVSCSPNRTSINTGDYVTWSAYASGGNGLYSYSWSGTDSLYGSNSSISKNYYSLGMKYASVTVYSNGQSVTQNCGNINVYQPTYSYSSPVYYYNTPYQNLSVSCIANTNYANTNSPVTWTASANGGNGYYTYSWSGSDGLYGNGQSVSTTYGSAGNKLASVTVNSAGQTVTQSCGNTIAIGNTYNYALASNSGTLDVGCYSDPANINTNQPVTWNVEVSGGSEPYKYSWTGSDGLVGTQASIIKYYSKAGEKNAIVTVTSADGKTTTRACSNTLAVANPNTYAKAKTTTTVASNTTKASANTDTSTTNAKAASAENSAAALFSLANVPWGWVAILVILVLFATVLYLLFNAKKI